MEVGFDVLLVSQCCVKTWGLVLGIGAVWKMLLLAVLLAVAEAVLTRRYP
jgi:hypothetical protein